MLPFHDLASARGKLAENVMHFARLLREAGLPVGPARVIDCVEALSLPGFLSSARGRDDFYWSLSALLLSREQQRPIFDQAFALFWRDPKLAEKMMQLLLILKLKHCMQIKKRYMQVQATTAFLSLANKLVKQ